MSDMQPNQQESHSTGLIASLVIVAVLLLGAIGFGAWAYTSRQDYKDNVDQKVSDAVRTAKQKEGTRKDAEFAELSKSPLKIYLGPEDFGSINLKYPKTWSGYVINSDSAPFVDGYFNPGVVPDAAAETSVFALRIRVGGDSYSAVMERYSSDVEGGLIKVSPYKLPQVPGVVGSKITGQIEDNKKGTMIVLPLRANALEIWTESDKNAADFTKYILPNFSFAP